MVKNLDFEPSRRVILLRHPIWWQVWPRDRQTLPKEWARHKNIGQKKRTVDDVGLDQRGAIIMVHTWPEE